MMQLYGMSASEVVRLSDTQIQDLVQHAENVAKELVQSNPPLQQAVTQKLAAVRRAVRSAADDSSDGTLGGPSISSDLGKLYNMSVTDVMKLSPSEANLMRSCGAMQAENLLLNSPVFMQQLQQRLSPVKRAVRNGFDEMDSSSGSTGGTGGMGGMGGAGGGGLGPPPGL